MESKMAAVDFKGSKGGKFKKGFSNNKKKNSKRGFPQNRQQQKEDESEILRSRYNQMDPLKLKNFKDFPLSKATQKALKESGFLNPTEIQKESIPLALRGLDVLGAAKTGSGKTLGFVIPILEKLHGLRWNAHDGLGALVITPTRELAFQIFETLRKVGRFHELSAGLVIGGKDLAFETSRLATCNIVVCTPGRLLHHMDQNPDLDAGNLQILVLDEADRILDMGFKETMDGILANLPTKGEGGRQTLLFSATQTRSVAALARLSLEDPVYVSVHEHSNSATPDSLTQNYTVCPIEQKINLLWSFIKGHKRKKIMVFFQSCKQVKFAAELFRRLRVPIQIMALYGTLHQLRRMAIYQEFVRTESSIAMFATDIAARGLDFPAVDWVIQMDCPEDAKTYLHRAGRTARHASSGGQSLLVLLPSEEPAMVKQLKAHKIPVEKIEVNPKKMAADITRKIQAHLASDHELKESAARAFQAYVKSTYLLKNKAVFDVFSLDLEKFATSLGLAAAPRVRFLQRQMKAKGITLKADTASSSGLQLNDSGDEDEDDLLQVKRKDHQIEVDEGQDQDDLQGLEEPKSKVKVITKAAAAKKALKKSIKANQVTRFDEEGDPMASEDLKGQKLSEAGKKYDEGDLDRAGIDLEKAREVLKAEDQFDKQLERARLKERKREEKRKLKEAKKAKSEDPKASDDEDEEELEGSEPDLDWLPDPDKIYGKIDQGNESGDNVDGDQDDSDGQEESDSDQDDETDQVISKKRKWKAPKKPKSQSKRSKQDPDLLSNLNSAEDLALQLLRH